MISLRAWMCIQTGMTYDFYKKQRQAKACRCKILFFPIRRAETSDQSGGFTRLPSCKILRHEFGTGPAGRAVLLDFRRAKSHSHEFGSRPCRAVYLWVLVERRVTSWAPPSTMETEETRVSLASRIRSGMFRTPTLHMVDLTLYMEASTLSCREPA